MTWHRDDLHARERGLRQSAKAVTSASPEQPHHEEDRRGPRHLEHEGYLIKELQQRLRTQIETRTRAKGLWLSFPHSAVLITLREEPGLSGAQLARRNSVTAQTMNGLLMPLEAKGLITRRPDPENARVLKCYLKPKGEELLQRGMHEASVVFDLMLGRLSKHEREEFRRILRRCIEALQSGGEQPSTDENVSALAAADSVTSSQTRAHVKGKTQNHANAVVRLRRKPSL